MCRPLLEGVTLAGLELAGRRVKQLGIMGGGAIRSAPGLKPLSLLVPPTDEAAFVH